MKRKDSEEFKKFDKTMESLLAVPYAELQEKLDAEKRAKTKAKKRGRSTDSSARVSAK